MSGAAEHASVRTYLRVWGLLAVLTAVEVGIVFLPVPHGAIVTGLLLLAATKAALVAFFFMHLKFDGRLVRFIGVAPFLFVAILLIFVMVDVVALSRNLYRAPMPAPHAVAHRAEGH